MTVQIIANAPAGHTPPDVPRKENGDLYEYLMTYENGRYLAYADSTAELLDVLVPGYLDSDEDGRIRARIDLALSVQVQAQAQVLASLTPEERASLKDWEFNVLAHSNGQPHGWAEAAGEPVEESSGETVDIWYSSAPLVLVDTGYQPFTDTPRPLSALGDTLNVTNIVWLRASDEEDLLDSLSLVGFVSFFHRKNV